MKLYKHLAELNSSMLSLTARIHGVVEDAEKEEGPKMLKNKSWEEMKLFIEEKLNNYLKNSNFKRF